MLSPKRTKFRKQQRGRLRGKTIPKKRLVFGDYGLEAQEPVWLNRSNKKNDYSLYKTWWKTMDYGFSR